MPPPAWLCKRNPGPSAEATATKGRPLARTIPREPRAAPAERNRLPWTRAGDFATQIRHPAEVAPRCPQAGPPAGPTCHAHAHLPLLLTQDARRGPVAGESVSFSKMEAHRSSRRPASPSSAAPRAHALLTPSASGLQVYLGPALMSSTCASCSMLHQCSHHHQLHMVSTCAQMATGVRAHHTPARHGALHRFYRHMQNKLELKSRLSACINQQSATQIQALSGRVKTHTREVV